MEREEFKAAISEAAALLTALKKYIPARVDQELLDFLNRLRDDPCGLDLLRNTLAIQRKP